jgi:SAM-dependent methyltransferase
MEMRRFAPTLIAPTATPRRAIVPPPVERVTEDGLPYVVRYDPVVDMYLLVEEPHLARAKRTIEDVRQRARGASVTRDEAVLVVFALSDAFSSERAETAAEYALWGEMAPWSLDALGDLLGVQSGGVFYDIGFGHGALAMMMAFKFGLDVAGIEYDPARVARSRTLYARVRDALLPYAVEGGWPPALASPDAFERAFAQGDVTALPRIERADYIFFYNFNMDNGRHDDLIAELDRVVSSSSNAQCYADAIRPSHHVLEGWHSAGSGVLATTGKPHVVNDRLAYETHRIYAYARSKRKAAVPAVSGKATKRPRLEADLGAEAAVPVRSKRAPSLLPLLLLLTSVLLYVLVFQATRRPY